MADDEETSVMDSITSALTTIATDKLKETGKGFYNIDFLLGDDNYLLSAEAGIAFSSLLKISATLTYDIVTGEFKLGTRLGGELSL
jgi:hypothetical protein